MSRYSNQRGFTIIELLIAMSVFTIVLLVLTGAIVQIGRLYYKGLTMSRTQEATRNVIEDVTRSIHYTPGVVKNVSGPGTNRGVCVGLRRYSFVQGQQTKLDLNRRSLVSDENPGGCPSNVALNIGATTAGNSMLSDGMRLSNLSVQDNSTDPTLPAGAYRVTVRVVYGDDDLLCLESGVPASGATCTNNTQMASTEIAGASNLRCKDIRNGSEFCAVSELSTIVERRLR